MRRVIMVVGFALLAMIGEGAVRVPVAHCTYCYSGTCYSSSMCFHGCFCLTRGGGGGGQCFSTQHAPGYTLLP